GEVDLHSMPPTDTTCELSMYTEYQPIVNLQDSSSKIEFKVTGNTQHYIDLHDNFLLLKVKVMKKDGTTNLEADSTLAPVSCFLHSLFSQLDISFNNQLISTSHNAYPYRAFIETLLSYGSDYS